MFRNILVPTDGSPLSRKAVRQAVRLAKELKARITGYYVGPSYKPGSNDDSVAYHFVSPQQHAASVEKTAGHVLDEVRKEAAKAGVPCTCSFTMHDFPYLKIVEAAGRNRCDLIIMATHGRRGISRLLLGSETNKVLAHSKVPVLVCR
jgi:nucleotide-binding universal stress UspA family protein